MRDGIWRTSNLDRNMAAVYLIITNVSVKGDLLRLRFQASRYLQSDWPQQATSAT